MVLPGHPRLFHQSGDRLRIFVVALGLGLRLRIETKQQQRVGGSDMLCFTNKRKVQL